MFNKSLTKKWSATVLPLDDRNSDSAPLFCINGPSTGFGSLCTCESLSPLQCNQLTGRVQFSYKNVVANEAEALAHLNTFSLVLCHTGRDLTAHSARTAGQKTNVSRRNI